MGSIITGKLGKCESCNWTVYAAISIRSRLELEVCVNWRSRTRARDRVLEEKSNLY